MTSIGGGFSIKYFDAATGEINSVVGPLASLTLLESLELNATYDVTDLSPLFGLSRLNEMVLTDCDGLTKAEIKKLRRALPECDIE